MTSIVWDFDGTLANSYPGMVTAVQQSLKDNFQIDISRDTIFKDIKKTSIRNYVQELFSADESTKDNVEANVKTFYHDYKFIEHEHQDDIVLMPHALKTLKALQEKGIQQFVITHRDQSIFEIAKALKIAQYFDEIVSVEDNFTRKPDPNMLEYLMNKHHVAPKDLLVIGDRKIDIDFGDSVGASTVLYSDKQSDFGQDKTVSDLKEICDLV
ncbi:HAD-IA family hydrolase [Companilactobacillus furfuricola]|uniref:HAD-IA family hydrolase n=1 Tax=Companilactobacillus furfuricola TaxID=1462575 RepID=UPI000F79C560|nr:HAD-IA family hydrolase [Companilactobacillus furfuricola]